MEQDYIDIFGAKEHNLKDINLRIPRNHLVTITGLSGSGKSSLAFDTLYAEGKRRYMETFSVYARNFMGGMERPKVEKINGLSPVIAIDQKTTNKNPHSTVGTITEVYDYLRLLFARASDAYSIITGEKMVHYTENQITDIILKTFQNRTILILAPLVKGRKGHYRELFQQIAKKGYLKVRVDGVISNIYEHMQVDRYKVHDIDAVVDKVNINTGNDKRIREDISAAFKLGKGSLTIYDEEMRQARHFSSHLMCPTSGMSYPEPEPNTFSFNSPYGACPRCNGLGKVTIADLDKIIPDPTKTIAGGAIAPLGRYSSAKWIFHQLDTIGKQYGFTLQTPVNELDEETLSIILYGSNNLLHMEGNPHTHYGSRGGFDGIITFITDQLEQEDTPKSVQRWALSFMNQKDCPVCKGTRLRQESLYFRIGDKNIAQLSAMSLDQLHLWLQDAHQHVAKQLQPLAHDIIKEIRTRVSFLLDVGLGYLSLDRSSSTLSGGEAQRIRLATQIGTKLVNVLYILDEPSIGLHQRDNLRLIHSLKKLRDLGNSVVVVEHDKDMILHSDYVVDIGPGAGIHGGYVVAQGSPDELKTQHSLTCDYINGTKHIKLPAIRRKGNGKILSIVGARGNNLKNITVNIPLGSFICITGVSGSGKSTLINDTLYTALSKHFYRSLKEPLPYDRLEGLKFIDKVVEVNQSPIGRTPRSNPGTYVGVFDHIRKLFAELPAAQIRGYTASRFSFNVKGGRCETCGGAGMKTISMNFLPDVYVPCEACNGKRYKKETLEIRYKGKSISDVLNMTINEAVEFFEHIPQIAHMLQTLQDVGLGYITIGQSSTSLSGGEAQRVKLATELARKSTGNTFYILDEPTTGLHFEDVNILLQVLQQLVDKGNTVLVVEHNLDVIKAADYLIDIGPDGGEKGGYLVAAGTPEEIAQNKESITGQFLKDEL